MMRLSTAWVVALLWIGCVPHLDAQALNRKPYVSLGHPRLTATATDPLDRDTDSANFVEGREFNQPLALAIDTSSNPPVLYVADAGNNRVLAWKNALQFVNGAFADLIIGQKDRYSTLAQGPGRSLTSGLNTPTALAVDKAGNLYVADAGNNRILRYPKPFAQAVEYKVPDLVLGQLNLGINTANAGGISDKSLALGGARSGLALDRQGNLWVSDTGNNRILRYRSGDLVAGRNGPAADLVLGQVDFLTNTVQGGRTSKTALSGPGSLAIDDQGRVLTTDRFSRVVVFEPPFRSGIDAKRILGIQTAAQGQPPPPPVNDSSLGGADGPAQGVFLLGARVGVADTGNHRIMIYDSPELWPTEQTAFSPAARFVFGQENFLSARPNRGDPANLQRTPDPSSNSLQFPFDAFLLGDELFVVDTGNHRVIVVTQTSPGVLGNATRVLGQFGFSYSAANLIEGREFNSPAALIVDTTVQPPRLYVADSRNNRVLGFRDFQKYKLGDRADVVIGQPDFLSSTLNYPSGDVTLPTDSGLAQPSGLLLDNAGNLYVADTGNGRVLRFPKPFEQPRTALQRADLVIGQATFTDRLTEPTARTMRAPVGLAFTGESATSAADRGALIVSDATNNRVLYFPKPFSNGMAATKVFGQIDFTSTSSNADPERNFSSPRHIAVDSDDRLYVCDSGRGRVLIFDRAPGLTNQPTPAQTLGRGAEGRQAGDLTTPVGIAISPVSGRIWVADAQQNRIVRFPKFDQLFTNNAPDSAVFAVSPVAAALDRFENLLAADSSSRILYFVPELSVTNAANFLSRPLAPGAIVSVFPFNSSLCGNTRCDPVPFGADTKSFDSLPAPIPLPRDMVDIQMRVNQQPAGLFFVSPQQINALLPINLPNSGTARLEIVRPFSGQILGFVDVRMDAASPGLFSLNSNGAGGAAALNEEAACRPEPSFFRCFNLPTNPIARGQVIQLFGTGQGFIEGAPPDGFPATEALPTAERTRVSLNGEFVDDANVLYSGLAPGLIGVWQVNVRVPQSVTPGNFIPVNVVLRSIGTASPTTRITISVK